MSRANVKVLTVALVAGCVAMVSAKSASAQCYERVVYSSYDYYPAATYVAPTYVSPVVVHQPVYVSRPVYAPVYAPPVYSRSVSFGFGFGRSGFYGAPYRHSGFRFSSGRSFGHGRGFYAGHHRRGFSGRRW